MPRCSRCNAFTRKPHPFEDGRTVVYLCDLCAAQKELAETPALRPEDLTRRPPWWERLKRFLRGGRS